MSSRSGVIIWWCVCKTGHPSAQYMFDRAASNMFYKLSLRQICVSFCLVFLLLDVVDVLITVIATAGYTIEDSDKNENETQQEHFDRKSLPVLSRQYINPHLPRWKLFLKFIIIILFLKFSKNLMTISSLSNHLVLVSAVSFSWFDSINSSHPYLIPVSSLSHPCIFSVCEKLKLQ